MTKDYMVVNEEKLTILGHKVKVITERFSPEYLNSNRFEPRCFRCCFYSGQPSYVKPCICQYIRCNGYGHERPHFELDE